MIIDQKLHPEVTRLFRLLIYSGFLGVFFGPNRLDFFDWMLALA